MIDQVNGDKVHNLALCLSSNYQKTIPFADNRLGHDYQKGNNEFTLGCIVNIRIRVIVESSSLKNYKALMEVGFGWQTGMNSDTTNI